MFDITFLMNASGDVVFHSLSCNVHWGMTGGFMEMFVQGVGLG